MYFILRKLARFLLFLIFYMYCCSVIQLCSTPCNPMDCNTPGFPIHHQLPEFTQTHVHWVSEAIHLVLCCPLLLLPSIFPSIKVFSSEQALCIRWPKDWSFSFSPSSEYSELMSFRIDWFVLLAHQGTQESSPAPRFTSVDSSVLTLLYGPNHIHTWLLEKP